MPALNNSDHPDLVLGRLRPHPGREGKTVDISVKLAKGESGSPHATYFTSLHAHATASSRGFPGRSSGASESLAIKFVNSNVLGGMVLHKDEYAFVVRM